MPNYVEIRIELEPHLIKYVASSFPERQLNVTKTSEIGIFILAMLTNDADEKALERMRRPRANNEISIMICSRYTEHKERGKFLTAAAVDMIKKKIRSMFITDLRLYVRQAHLDWGINEKDALRNYFKKYEITEDDFQEESMYRDYSRWKKSKKIDVE